MRHPTARRLAADLIGREKLGKEGRRWAQRAAAAGDDGTREFVGVDRVNFLKLDVEEAEREVWKGCARSATARGFPLVMVEFTLELIRTQGRQDPRLPAIGCPTRGGQGPRDSQGHGPCPKLPSDHTG